MNLELLELNSNNFYFNRDDPKMKFSSLMNMSPSHWMKANLTNPFWLILFDFSVTASDQQPLTDYEY